MPLADLAIRAPFPPCNWHSAYNARALQYAATSLMLESTRGHDANTVVILEEDDDIVVKWKVGCRSGRLS